MIETTKEYQEAIIQPSREIRAKAKFNGVTLLDDNKVISVSLEEISNSEDTLKIGELNSSKSTLKFVMPDEKIPLKGGSFSIASGLLVNDEFEFIDKGTFYIDEIEDSVDTNIVTVIGYDSVYRMNVEYVPNITYPALLKDVIDDICKQCNITHAITEIPDMTIDSYIEGTTCRVFMGYCLGLMGKNGRMNTEDKLVAYWYNDSGFKITWDNQFQGGFKRTTDEDIVINSLTSGTSENTLTSGSGYGITFENPYMTQEILDEIYERVKGFTYTPSNIEWRGNPSLEIDDVVQAEDKEGNFHNVIFSEHTLNVTGMRSTVTCKGSLSEIVMDDNSPTKVALKKLYNTLTNAFKETTENILGHNGGYYTVDLNEEGFPSGWTIMNTPTLRDDTKLWKMTAGGLGYSEDGGKTFKNIAFDLEGNFNANVINTGAINGEMFSFDLNTGVIKVGKRDANGEISDPTLYVNELGELRIKAIEKIEEELGGLDLSLYRAELLTSGTIINENNRTITLDCKVYSANDDVTDKQQDLQFNWLRNDAVYKTGKSIAVGSVDVDVSANFKCLVTIGELTLDTGCITIIDETDISNLGNSYLDCNAPQQYLDGTFFPDFTTDPLVITPCVMDDNIVIDLKDCDISYKKIVNGLETDLTDETVTNGVLTLNKNIMDRKNSYLNYACTVTYKNSTIKLFKEISLILQGQDAILLNISSSNGTSFKNNDIATSLIVTIFVGDRKIDTSQAMKEEFGDDAKIIWMQKQMGEDGWTELEQTDKRISDDGFILTITSNDINTKCTFTCTLDF